MQVIEKNIFTQISAEQSANVNGGGNSAGMNLLLAGALASVLDAFDLDETNEGQITIIGVLAGIFG
ncbi:MULTISPECIES: hypothetical protein [unclassified Anabaena]|uniref:hypothetical protein n=1 Tax=unclassified Anabaena TaxID=2619674 RepID=UPI000A4CAA9B|nr:MULTISPECIES: hypothetical protein [unclassified Anabaena]